METRGLQGYIQTDELHVQERITPVIFGLTEKVINFVLELGN
jgi:hypothetical protein